MPADTTSLAFDFERRRGETLAQSIRINRRDIRPTPVFHAYWRFAAERQAIFHRRLRGDTHRLTDDPVLCRFKFTNAYRASDRVSQYLIRSVIYRDDLPGDARNVFFRTLLFKLFNKIETWCCLERALGAIRWEEFDPERYDLILSERMAQGERIYSAAYIMPSAGFGFAAKHGNHLRLIEHMVTSAYPERLGDCATMREAYALLLSAPSIGPFLAYQFATDLNYSEITNFDEGEFVVPGPGALDGISKCFFDPDGLTPADIIAYMFDHQERHFAEQGIDFQNLWGRRLQLIDCQNLFCEISKYARVAFPEHEGSAGRTRIKQKFTPERSPLPAPWYPPKWGLNSKIAAGVAS